MTLALQRLVGLLPASRPLIDHGDGLCAVVRQQLARHLHRLVSISLQGLVVDFHTAPVDAALALGYALAVLLVALTEMVHVAGVEVAQRPARLDIEHPLGRVLPGNRQRAIQQLACLLRVVVYLDVDNVQVDGRHTLVVARLLHHLDHLLEQILGRLLVATVAVQVAQHVVGHIHLLVQLPFLQFLRQLPCQLVGLKDSLVVHQKHDLIAALGVVGMQVALLQQIVLQILQCGIEAGTVTAVEAVLHGVAQRQILRRRLVVFALYCECSQQQDDGCKDASHIYSGNSLLVNPCKSSKNICIHQIFFVISQP